MRVSLTWGQIPVLPFLSRVILGDHGTPRSLGFLIPKEQLVTVTFPGCQEECMRKHKEMPASLPEKSWSSRIESFPPVWPG